MKLLFTFLYTLVAFTLGNNQAQAAAATADISVFKEYAGDYVLDASLPCNEAYGGFNMSLDSHRNAIVLVFSGNNTAGIPIPNGVPQYTEISLTNTTDLPVFPVGERRARTVIEGNSIVDQIQEKTFLVWGFWRDNDTQMSFAQGDSITLSYSYNDCKFVRKP